MARRSFAITTVLFDLDGTTIDSAPDLMACLNKLLHAMERPLLSLEDVTRMIGDGIPMLVERGVAATGAPASEEALADLVSRFHRLYSGQAMVQRTRPFPGVIETLDKLRAEGYRTALVTNKAFRATTGILSALDLMSRFDEIIGGDTLPVRKPDPGPLLEAMRRLGAENHQAVMVGDSEADTKAAHAAGIPIILVSYGYTRGPVAEIGGDRIIDTMSALPELLAEINRDGLPDRWEQLTSAASERVQAVLDDPRVKQATEQLNNTIKPVRDMLRRPGSVDSKEG